MGWDGRRWFGLNYVAMRGLAFLISTDRVFLRVGGKFIHVVSSLLFSLWAQPVPVMLAAYVKVIAADLLYFFFNLRGLCL